MKNKPILVILLLLLVYGSEAQQNKFQLGIGYQRTWMLDKQASPLKYQSSEKTFSLGYTHTGSADKFNVQLNGALGKFFPTGFADRKWYNPGYNSDGSPKTDSGVLMGKIYNARFNMGYARQVSSGFSMVDGKKWENRNYVGGSFSNQLFYTDNIVRNGWMNSSSINADFQYDALYNSRHSFSVKILIPIFARNTRLPYHNTVSSSTGEGHVKAILKQGSRFAWLGNFQNIQFDAGYEYAINKNVGMGIHYFAQWLHYSYEKPINLFQNNIGITASIK
ncbi:hypothetical protein [Flavihumibacter fluvii]|uniref:hypothetical protein n=1 Tax=Flavihumibacter fluvii TaxID=2838157 RepID=UPI001BDF4292|nr:hypothetical protein [Flavihumibacter fluvii]ULQ54194.1 hypothetical protein KJS93_07670 [Flavihumibacter fluvii]